MTGKEQQQQATKINVSPATRVAGTLVLPGDKSISHRYAMLASIAEGKSILENFSTGADCESTLASVRALGAGVSRRRSSVEVEGRGPILSPPSSALDCGNSGSTMRMLSGILAGQPFECELSGDESLSKRPMARIIDPLTRMGATIDSNNGCPPLRVRGGSLHSINYATPVPSAQVKSAVLFAGLYAGGATSVEESLPTRDHTELALRAFGADIQRSKNRSVVTGQHGGPRLNPIETSIPGDISTAAFFLCAAALLPGSDLLIDNLLLNPTRSVLLDFLVAMGLRVSFVRMEERHGELAGTVHVQHGSFRGGEISGAITAALIDEIPVLAAIAPFSEKGMEIRDARELRVKESDRIAAASSNLRAMGAQVEEMPDGLRIPGGQSLHGGEVDSFGDHRIAMAFAIAALGAKGCTVIHRADAARISFPEFFTALDRVVVR